jgi:hypothetical protein
MHKWKYIIGIIVLWLVFSTATILALFQFVLTYGKIEVKVDYTAFNKENVTIYWDKGTGWAVENRFNKTSSIGRNVYTYHIRHTDTIFALRIDPDDACDSVILHSVSVSGVKCALSFNDFSNNEHHNSRIVKQSDGFKIYRDAKSDDPNLVIPIPVSCRSVVYQWKTSEIIYIILTLIFDIGILIFIIRRRFLKRFFENQNFWKVLFVFAFLLCISMYWTDRGLNFYPQQPNIENRRLVKFPKWTVLANKPDSLFNCCTQWCSDFFPYRNMLIGTRSAAYMWLFKESPIPGVVMIGKNNMFFSALEPYQKDFIGIDMYPRSQVNDMYHIAQEKQDILAANGIPFFLVLVPAKQTVYSELMPDYFRLQHTRPSFMDRIAERISKEKINFMCLTDTLINLKQQYPERQLFYNYDTHWTEYGAFRSYQSVMNWIYSIDTSYGRPMRENEITIDTFKDNQADLAKCLIVNDIYKRTRYNIQPVLWDTVLMEKIIEKDHGPTFIYRNPKGHGRVLFFRDSYMLQWAPFFTHHFKECILIWDHHMYMDEIMKYKPDIVIEEVGEFYIDHLLYPIKTIQE